MCGNTKRRGKEMALLTDSTNSPVPYLPVPVRHPFPRVGHTPGDVVPDCPLYGLVHHIKHSNAPTTITTCGRCSRHFSLEQGCLACESHHVPLVNPHRRLNQHGNRRSGPVSLEAVDEAAHGARAAHAQLAVWESRRSRRRQRETSPEDESVWPFSSSVLVADA